MSQPLAEQKVIEARAEAQAKLRSLREENWLLREQNLELRESGRG